MTYNSIPWVYIQLKQNVTKIRFILINIMVRIQMGETTRDNVQIEGCTSFCIELLEIKFSYHAENSKIKTVELSWKSKLLSWVENQNWVYGGKRWGGLGSRILMVTVFSSGVRNRMLVADVQFSSLGRQKGGVGQQVGAESGSAEGGSGSTGWCGAGCSPMLVSCRHLSRPGSPTSHLVLDGWQGKGIRMIIFIRFPS